MKTVIITNIILVMTAYSSLLFGEEAKSYVSDDKIKEEIEKRAAVYDTMMNAMLDKIPHAQTVKASEVLNKQAENKLPKCAAGLDGQKCFDEKQILVVGFDYTTYKDSKIEPISGTSYSDLIAVLPNIFPYYGENQKVFEIKGYGEGEIGNKTPADFLNTGIKTQLSGKESTIMFLEGQQVLENHFDSGLTSGLFLSRDKSCFSDKYTKTTEELCERSRMIDSADLNKVLLENGDIHLFNGTDTGYVSDNSPSKDFWKNAGFVGVDTVTGKQTSDNGEKYQRRISDFDEFKIPKKPSNLPEFLKSITDSSCDLDKDGNFQVTLNEVYIHMLAESEFTVSSDPSQEADTELPAPYDWEKDLLVEEMVKGEDKGITLFNGAAEHREKYGKEYQESKNSLDYSVVINLDPAKCNDGKKGTVPQAPEMTDIATYISE